MSTNHQYLSSPVSSDTHPPSSCSRSPTSPRSIFHSYWSSPTCKDKQTNRNDVDDDDDDVLLARLETLQLPHLPGMKRNSFRFRGLNDGRPIPDDGIPLPIIHLISTTEGSFDGNDSIEGGSEGGSAPPTDRHLSCLRPARYSSSDVQSMSLDKSRRPGHQLKKAVSFNMHVKVLEYTAAKEEIVDQFVDRECWKVFFS